MERISKILIIEDDWETVEAISLAIHIRWRDAKLYTSDLGEKGIELAERENPDVIILDLGLPDISGFDVLDAVRLFSSVPILILSARSDEADVIRGLEMGADEYVIKPFRKLELLSRLEALTRRRGPLTISTSLVCGPLSFNPTTMQLAYNKSEISLTPTEGSILYLLMKNVGHFVTYNDIAETIWGDSYPDSIKSIRVHIRRLREKIIFNQEQSRLIVNKPGVGYRLAVPA